MIERPIWKERILTAWGEAPIVWLSGVRRSGKTTLAHGRNYLVTPSGDPAYVRRYGELEVTVCTPAELRE